jgi:uncharacterized lipoprotein YddW (UPF0748 family)
MEDNKMYIRDRGKRMHILRLTLAVVVITIVCAGVCSAYTAGSPEFRAIYADAWHNGCMNASQINQLISDAHSCNANTIVAQVRRRGDTIYPSSEPTASGFSSGFDSLADLIQKCHSTSPRLDVQAWFVVWPIASDSAVPSNPNHPYNRYRQYLTKDSTGQTDISGDFWFDPGHPGAEQYTYNIIMDVVNRYDVDGINFDYIRFGGGGAGYNDVSVARFNSASARYAGDFSAWRRDQVTNFVRKVYANAIAVKPNIKVTADCYAGSPAPVDLADFNLRSQAYTKFFQNWPAWMQEGILDMDLPMDYIDCSGGYAGLYDPWVCFTHNYVYNRQCAIAPGVYYPSCLTSQLLDTRNLSCGTTNGAAVYAYNALQLGGQPMFDAIRAVWTTPAAVPVMPWKTSAPTKGHIKGNVTFAGSIWIDGAAITLTGPVNRTMYTDGTGFFAFIDLPQGTYTVTCVANGYGTITKSSLHVYVGQVVSADCDYPLSTLIISNVQAGSETQSSAIITWTTNAASSSKVYYGPDRTCSQSTTEDNTQVTSHSVTVTGLSPGTTYYYRVYSMFSGVPAAMSSICAVVTSPATPADIIIESRSGGKNVGWYSELNATGDSTAKSTAVGCTPSIGCRYMSLASTYNKEAHYKPAITTAGQYQVTATWGNSSGGSNIKHTVTYNGGQYTTSFNQSLNRNVWNSIGTFSFLAGGSGSCGEVKQWADGLDGSNRILADAVKFSWAGGESVAPSTPTNLTATSIQDDTVNLGWTASTDNVAVAGYRIFRGPTSTVTVVDSSPTNSYADTDVAPNTRYWYAVSAYDTSGNKSGSSAQISLLTLPVKPSSATISCDKQAGVWQTAGPFTFTSYPSPWGYGKVNYYRYAWDTNPSHTWDDTEFSWVGGAKAITTTPSASPYYLHIRGYNQDATPGDNSDLGPYYLDTTAPGAPAVTDDGGYTPLQTSVHASWSSDEPESGIIGYQYAVGTTSGGTDLVNWTTTTDPSATITIPSQTYGTVLYVSVKAQNGAQLWSDVGTSDGIKVARSVATVAEARSLDNTGIPVYLEGRYVSAVFATCFYIQDDKWGSGIRVEGTCPYAVGSQVNVGGILGKNAANERNITSATVSPAP